MDLSRHRFISGFSQPDDIIISYCLTVSWDNTDCAKLTLIYSGKGRSFVSGQNQMANKPKI
jgi:hypothetical protein